jgi:NAD(P)-dependent dehydrogenase (short-subunit alcohol dehydrogenase family)
MKWKFQFLSAYPKIPPVINVETLRSHQAMVIRDELIRKITEIAPHVKGTYLPIELDDLQSVKNAATQFLALNEPLDILINNAGLLGKKGLTKDGYEVAFGTNHLGHFLLTQLLRPALLKSPTPRILNLASNAHRSAEFYGWDDLRTPTKSEEGYPEYGFSKVCNMLHVQEIVQREEYKGVTAYSVHPGVILTEIWRYTSPPARLVESTTFLKNANEGCQNTLFCAFTPEDFPNGSFIVSKKPSDVSEMVKDKNLQKELWEFSMKAVQAYL